MARRLRIKAGAKLKGGNRLRFKIRQAKRAQKGMPKGVRAGFWQSAKYPDGTPVTNVAAWNTFGTRTIPQRPFMQLAVQSMQKPVLGIVKAHIDPKTMAVTRQIAELVGQTMKSEIQRQIVELRTPPNAPSTVGRKGSSNPLVDTGFMRISVTFRVVTSRGSMRETPW